WRRVVELQHGVRRNADRDLAVGREIVAAAGKLDRNRFPVDADRDRPDAAQKHAADDTPGPVLGRYFGTSGQLDVLRPDSGERVSMKAADHVHPADESRHETIGRTFVELDRTSDLLDPAAIH